MGLENKSHRDKFVHAAVKQAKRNIKTDTKTALTSILVVYDYLYNKKIKLLNMYSGKNKNTISRAGSSMVREWHSEYNFVKNEIGHVVEKNRRKIEDGELKIINAEGCNITRRLLSMYLFCERFAKHKEEETAQKQG